MSIFKKPEPQPQKPRERLNLPGRAITDGAISIIGPGMVIDGDIVTEGTVRVEGVLRGTVQAGRAVIVGAGGRIEGDVVTEDAVIGGSFNGSIMARNRLELQSTCSVVGVLRTRAEGLKLDEGAHFAGRVDMSDDAAPSVALTTDASDEAGTEEPEIGHHALGTFQAEEDEEELAGVGGVDDELGPPLAARRA
jgi:cytoskeletal protein CcmA (bactofilin family)